MMSIWYLYCYYFTPQFSTVKCLPEKTSFFGTRNDFVLQFLIQKRHWTLAAIGRPYPFKFFKGCLPQILLGPFLNTLSHIKYKTPYHGYDHRYMVNSTIYRHSKESKLGRGTVRISASVYDGELSSDSLRTKFVNYLQRSLS